MGNAPSQPAPGHAADAPRPSLAFSIDIPDHWTVLDLNAKTQGAFLDAFLDERLAGREQARRERGPARAVLADLLDELRRAQVFLAAILAGEAGGEVYSASATLAWRKLEVPVAGNLEALRRVYEQAPPDRGEERAARKVSIVELPVGGAVRIATRQAVAVPTTERRQVARLVQHLVPVVAIPWLAVLTASTANPALEAGVEEVADAIAESLRFGPWNPGNGNHPRD